MIDQSQTLSSSEIIFITLFFSAGAHRYCAFLLAIAKLCNDAAPKQIFFSQTSMF